MSALSTGPRSWASCGRATQGGRALHLGSVKEVVQWAFVEQDPRQVDMKQMGREVDRQHLKGCLA